MSLFETKLPQDLVEITGREEIDKAVVNRVVAMINDGKSLGDIDEYLLNEGRCTQDEREIITESLYGIV